MASMQRVRSTRTGPKHNTSSRSEEENPCSKTSTRAQKWRTDHKESLTKDSQWDKSMYNKRWGQSYDCLQRKSIDFSARTPTKYDSNEPNTEEARTTVAYSRFEIECN